MTPRAASRSGTPPLRRGQVDHGPARREDCGSVRLRLFLPCALGLLLSAQAASAAPPRRPAGVKALVGDLYGVGEHRLAARGLSILFRAALSGGNRGGGQAAVLDEADTGRATAGTRIVHQRVAATYLKNAEAERAAGGLLEPDGPGLRLIVRVYGSDGALEHSRGFSTTGRNLFALGRDGVLALGEHLALKPRELPFFTYADAVTLGQAGIKLEAGDHEGALGELERLGRNRPEVVALLRSYDNLALRVAEQPKLPTWVRIRAKLVAGRASEALDDAREWRHDRPKDLLGALLEARALLAIGKPGEVEKVLAEVPESSEGLLLRAQALRMLRRGKDAEKLYQRAVALGVDVGAAKLGLGELALAARSPDAAPLLLDASARLLEANEPGLAQLAIGRALDAGKVSLQGSSGGRPLIVDPASLPAKERTRLAGAMGLPATGNLSDAERRTLARLGTADPTLPEQDKQDFRKLAPDEAAGGAGGAGGAGAVTSRPLDPAAREAAVKAMDSTFARSEDVPKRLYQAELLLEEKRPSEARALLVATSRAPGASGDVRVQLALGRAYQASGQPRKAAEYFERAQTPGNEAATRALARSLEDAGEARRAAELHGKVSERKLEDPEALRAQSIASLQAGDAAGARTTIDRAIQGNPQDVTSHQIAAAAERKLGHTAEAAQEDVLARDLEVPGVPKRDVERILKTPESPQAAAAARTKRSLEELARSPLVTAMLKSVRLRELAEQDARLELAIVVRRMTFEPSLRWVTGYRPDRARLQTELSTALKVVLPQGQQGLPSPELEQAVQSGDAGAIRNAARSDHLELVLDVDAEVEDGTRVRLAIRPVLVAQGADNPQVLRLDEGSLIVREIFPPVASGGAVIFLIFALLAGTTVLRRTGTLVVTVKYDTTAESGLFSLVLARRHKEVYLKGGEEAYASEVLKGGSTVGKRGATMIKPVTTFKSLPTGTWYVYLYGVYIRLGKPDGNYVLEKTCVVKPKESTFLDFDLVGDAATILVDVWDENGPVPKVFVTCNGDAGTGVYTGDRGGGALFTLPPGDYTFEGSKGSRSAIATLVAPHPKPYRVTLRFDEANQAIAEARSDHPVALPDAEDTGFESTSHSDAKKH